MRCWVGLASLSHMLTVHLLCWLHLSSQLLPKPIASGAFLRGRFRLLAVKCCSKASQSLSVTLSAKSNLQQGMRPEVICCVRATGVSDSMSR